MLRFSTQLEIVGCGYIKNSQLQFGYAVNRSFTNEGPSPTNEDVTFKVYVPIKDFISDVKVSLDENITCEFIANSQPFQLSIDAYDNPIACNQDEGQKFHCHVYPLWKAETFHQIEVKFKFNATLANLDPDHTTFAIFTHVVDQRTSKLDFPSLPIVIENILSTEDLPGRYTYLT